MLVAIEGVDGAGKRTLSHGLSKAFADAGKSVATLAFPRYGRSITADIAAEALHGEHGDLASSVYGMAMLFALDRAGAVDELQGLRGDYDVVILDRYVASSAAYSAARLHEDAAGEAVAWVQRIEFQRLGLPKPDWQVLLAVSVELAGERSRGRAQREPGRARDSYERDAELQRRTGSVYAELAAAGWGGPWLVVDADVDPGRLAATLTAPDGRV
ncbi:dTMP kinase [Mycobacterium decipiens]|uniref:Thymidylate kinase n=1 Tax=Mycobacterium decipiens TaxID=1430326 RepID=A0A1X2M0N4_9MYCO|nr:dTMP kinase [Mycobacterium decipiens]OSC43106.1 thymidylate kinase [Mycobacterium decipiens]